MPARTPRPLRICRLDRIDYVEAAELQRSLRVAREAGVVEDLLLVLEHDPVITCGTRTEAQEIAVARTMGVPLVPVERGGKATYHGPGQVVVYPIVGIDVVDGDVRELVCRLEAAIIDTLALHDVHATRRPGLPGVWLDVDAPSPRKIASLGLRLTKGITFHGIALNVVNDLTPFEWFTPCGIPDAQATSVARELGVDTTSSALTDALLTDVERELVAAICTRFDFTPESIELADLRAIAAAHPAPAPHVRLPEDSTDSTPDALQPAGIRLVTTP